MDMSKYKGMFISETKEHLQTMNQLIISLEKDPSNQENIEALFRAAHSVKGMAASMGYNDVSELSHKLEDMMDLFMKGELILNSDAVDILFEGLDALEVMVKGVEDDQPADVDVSSLVEKISSIETDESKVSTEKEASSEPAEPEIIEIEAEEGIEAVATPGELQKEKLLSITIEIDGTAQVPGMRGFLAYKKLAEFGNVLSTDPDMEEVKEGNFDRKISLKLSTDKKPSEIKEILSSIVDLATFNVTEDKSPEEKTIGEKAETAEKEEKKAKPAVKKGPQVRTVRVTTDLLDNLINIVGEMIISRSRLFEVSKDIKSLPLKEGMVVMSNLIRDLHDQVMSVRMTPIENLTERLPRVVRDLARKGGKKVELSIEGKDIELDRAIVEEMGDPLVHILRNCVDHGIETTDDRKKSGKDPVGRIIIRAMRERDQVILNIGDDGRGMDPEKIKKKAIERGLIASDRAKAMSDREAFMLVCHSGLSTAEKVTDVSGRGVGMDAVRNVVDVIGGSMDIDSTMGTGTNISIKLPLTVAIVQVLLVRLGNEIYAVPINKVIRTLEVEKSDLKRSQKQLAVLVEEELIPLLSLRKVLNVEQTESKAPLIAVVVVELKGKQVGLVVDSLFGQQEAFIKPLEPPLEWIRGFSGATILGDGSVVFVLDIPNLL